MMACVASVVVVTPQLICGVAMCPVRNEKGTGVSSPGCISRLAQSIERPSRRAGVPVLRRPRRRSRASSRSDRPLAGSLAMAAGGGLFLAPMDQPAQEGAGGEHHCPGPDPAAIARDDPGHATVLDHQVLDSAFDHLEIGRRPDRGLHRLAVELAIGLGARTLHGGALGAIEQAELDAGGVRHPPHQAIQRIDLAHQMPLAEPADRRIAGHLADRGEPVGHQRRARAHAGRGSRSLAAGMAAADNNDVKSWRGHGSIRGANLAAPYPRPPGPGRCFT